VPCICACTVAVGGSEAFPRGRITCKDTGLRAALSDVTGIEAVAGRADPRGRRFQHVHDGRNTPRWRMVTHLSGWITQGTKVQQPTNQGYHSNHLHSCFIQSLDRIRCACAKELENSIAHAQSMEKDFCACAELCKHFLSATQISSLLLQSALRSNANVTYRSSLPLSLTFPCPEPLTNAIYLPFPQKPPEPQVESQVSEVAHNGRGVAIGRRGLGGVHSHLRTLSLRRYSR
jgi:hypothetical protein